MPVTLTREQRDTFRNQLEPLVQARSVMHFAALAEDEHAVKSEGQRVLECGVPTPLPRSLYPAAGGPDGSVGGVTSLPLAVRARVPHPAGGG